MTLARITLQDIKLQSGYAFESSRRHPRDPDTVMVGATEIASCFCVGYARIDGTECYAFRNRQNGRYFFQTAPGQ